MLLEVVQPSSCQWTKGSKGWDKESKAVLELVLDKSESIMKDMSEVEWMIVPQREKLAQQDVDDWVTTEVWPL